MAPRAGETFASRVGFSVILVIVLSIASVLFLNILIVLKLGKADRVDLTLAESPDGGGANYLLIGSDTREFSSDPAFGNGVGGQRSDTIMVLHFDPDSDRALLVSFPRDLWVDVPGRGDAKINAAFNEGPQSVIDTLSSNFNVPVHHYVEVNFESFQGMVEAIGTIPVYFPVAARDLYSNLEIFTPGCNELNGLQTLQFVRARHLELYDAAEDDWETSDPIPDIGRIGRQQAILRVIGEKAMTAAFTNPFKANKIADAAVSEVTLDSDFGRGDVFALADGFASSEEEPGPATLTLPTVGATRGGQSVLEATDDAETVLEQLRNFDTEIRSDAASDAIPTETLVRVLNGSGAEGAAADAISELTILGFIPSGTGNANERGVSEVRYAPGAEDKADLVASVVAGEVDVIEDDNVEGADVVLVLGGSFEGIIRTTTAPTPGPSTGAQPPPTASLAPVPGDCS
ncbi:MAG: LytR family transcriptional regulator [Actinobacteria bacterium]|nr:LytR family transcriptional regulator [Actinomycetota bacterium]